MRLGLYGLQGKQRSGWPGYGRTQWQWQPTLTAHDPSPPMILEDAAVEPPAGDMSTRTMTGVGT